MAFYDTPQGKAGLAIAAAALIGYVAYTGDVIGSVGVPGLQSRTVQVQQKEDSLTFLRAQTDSARRELARGTVDDVRRRVEEYRASLALLREFVPEGSEVPNLLDAISTRAKVRGVNLSRFIPRPVEAGPAPFDTYAYDMSVIGRYDQVGQFLTDIASLRRIFVPQSLTLSASKNTATRALGDSTAAMLEATFQVRTYVKSASGEEGGPRGS